MIKNPTEDDNGNYVCGVRNMNGIATSSAFVTVMDARVKKDLEDMNTYVKEDLEALNFMHKKDTKMIWITVVSLILFVLFVLVVFIVVKVWKKRSENTSKYLVQISPNESDDEIQPEFGNYKNDSMRIWVNVDVEEGNVALNNGVNNQENGGTMKKDSLEFSYQVKDLFQHQLLPISSIVNAFRTGLE